jgi:hypothetical protein
MLQPNGRSSSSGSVWRRPDLIQRLGRLRQRQLRGEALCNTPFRRQEREFQGRRQRLEIGRFTSLERRRPEGAAKKPANGRHIQQVSKTRQKSGMDGGGRSRRRTRLHPKFPANREKNRDLFNSGAISGSDAPVSPMFLGTYTQIPYSSEQEISGEKQRISGNDQGNFHRAE